MRTPDLIIQGSEQHCGAASLAVSPFVSNEYHFGMLLGVDDLETEQAYHRGKQWLHNAWLHGPGTVWGLQVELDADRHELIVHPGLAIDGYGRELYLRDRSCVDIFAWINAQPAGTVTTTDHPDGGRILTAYVELCHDTCLERPVPSISEPCEGANSATTYSRTEERALPRLKPGAVPREPGPYYPRLRQFFGQRAPVDPLVLKALADLQTAAPELKAHEWFRRIAAADTMDLGPGDSPSSPFEGDGCVPLAQVRIHLLGSDEQLAIVSDRESPSGVDNLVRWSHVRTRTIQELLTHCHDAEAVAATPPDDDDEDEDTDVDTDAPAASDPDAGPDGADGAGSESGTHIEGSDGSDLASGAHAVGEEAPQVVAGSAVIKGRSITVGFTQPLNNATVHRDAFRVNTLRADGWAPSTIKTASLSDDGLSVVLKLDGGPKLRPIRIVAEGAGAQPLLGTNGMVLSGVGGQPRVETGADGVAMIVADPATDEE